MTNKEAQQILLAYIQDWVDLAATEFIEESIEGSLDEEAKEALDLVGLEFDWSASVTLN